MTPRRARPPAWWPNPRRDLERVLVESIVRSLEDEGRAVSEVWSPEDSPTDLRMAGRPSRPDGALRIDGREAAIDVTGFWTSERGEAAVRAKAIGRLVEKALAEASLELRALVFLVYRSDELVTVDDRADQAADARAIATAVIAASGSEPVARQAVATATLPSWVDRLTLTLVAWRGRPEVLALPVQSDRRHIAETLDAIAARKGPQLSTWGLGIVGILRGLDNAEAEVAAYLSTRDWPFWRVYWCDAAGARLVWEARPIVASEAPADPTARASGARPS